MMSYMGQLTIYLPDEIEKTVRREAKRARKTVSAYITSLAKHEEPRDKNGYPIGYFELFGSMPGFEVPPRDRTPPEIPNLDSITPGRHGRVRAVRQGRPSAPRAVAGDASRSNRRLQRRPRRAGSRRVGKR